MNKIKQIIKLYQQKETKRKFSDREIAEKVGVSRQYVNKIIREYLGVVELTKKRR
uniref:Putative DNA binding, helix-turn-helix domain containing protein n=1 Tax=viral metagenome TaxID=1070528 RepID=A0A6H1ZF72_9ZZZZ